MKKIILVLLVLSLIPFIAWAEVDDRPSTLNYIKVKANKFKNPGDCCSSPHSIVLPVDLPFRDIGQTTCDRGNDHFGTIYKDGFDGGEDIIYEVFVLSDVTVDVIMTSELKNTSMSIDSECSDGDGSFLAFGSNDDIGGVSFYDLTLTAAGSPYYIQIDSMPSPNCIKTFNLRIKGPPSEAIGDDCTEPIVINIPADLPLTDAAQTNCGRGYDYSNSCLGSYDGGEDIIYELNVTAPTDVNILMDPKGTTWTGMYLAATCGDAGTCIDYCTTSGGAGCGLMSQSLAVGTYYIMIDTWPTPDCIPDFDLDISVAVPVGPGDDCGQPWPVAAPADLPYTHTDTTCGGVDDYRNSCLGLYDGGEDNIYELTVTAPIDVLITLDSGTTYTGMYIATTCGDAGTCIDTCDSGSASGGCQMLVTLGAGTYYIMVDTWEPPDCITTYDLTIEEFVPCDPAPTGALAEGEPCIADGGDDVTNGGCNNDPPIFSMGYCGQTVNGQISTYNTGGDTRDTDWYSVFVHQHSIVTFDVCAEFPVVIGTVETGYPGSLDCDMMTGYFDQYVTASPSVPAQLTTTCLRRGWYMFFVSTDSLFTGFPCAATDRDYSVSWSCTPCDYSAHCDADNYLADEYISNVTCGAINNTTGYDSYADYTANQSTDMEINKSYPITITLADSYSSDEVAVWIDWNQDLFFNDQYEYFYLGMGNGPHTGTINVPQWARPGTTRMRVRLVYTAFGDFLAPCGESFWGGEVEDYAVNVLDVTPVVLRSFEAQLVNKGVELTWITDSEIDILGFNVYRQEIGPNLSPTNQPILIKLNDAVIPGQGNGMVGAEYTLTDNRVRYGKTYRYILQSVELSSEMVDIGDTKITIKPTMIIKPARVPVTRLR
ncbi:GEVED domain-containing protein [candidate division CSSED10-310 bacterium]|uniref:GEVED domain-containing protein n=1 Tax=candidate division CSSED10-310 bacterium TaxID=2855610 RepID=A0ABV6Z5N1_UNCC1